MSRCPSTSIIKSHWTTGKKPIKTEGKGERRIYRLIVEKKGTQYKDVLSSVKAAITDDPARSSIHAMRSTRDGSLLITLDKDDETIEGLEKANHRKG
jgi:hypothetical protein